jgi:DNA modification methylase
VFNNVGGQVIDLRLGDCIEVMRSMPDDSVDSIVTDPPYELGFMGKSWDSTGIAFNVEVWQEALRVLKPGGHLLAFSGSRTYHRMAVAIEDAGFQIRDQIMWVYGSGFPKSHNVSKGIDKAAGYEGKVVGLGTSWNRPESEEGDTARMNVSPGEYEIKELSFNAQQWDGWGTALKPAHEPIVLARKPLIGTVANNVLTHGTGALNIDGCRVGSEVLGGGTMPNLRDVGAMSKETTGIDKLSFGQNPRPATRIEQDSYTGRWPANFIHDGSDEVVELFPEIKSGAIKPLSTPKNNAIFGKYNQANINSFKSSEGSAARFFYCAKASKRDRNEGLDGLPPKFRAGLAGADREGVDLDDVSERFRTQPSANNHPTVKPTDLMRYLCKLITPPNGVILDPFMGSGSTGKGAVIEGFNFIGIEQNVEYLDIAKARIEFEGMP